MNEAYIYDLLKLRNVKEADLAEHLELFIMSGSTISSNLINKTLEKFPNILTKKFTYSKFNPHNDNSGFGGRNSSLLSNIVYSLYISGDRNKFRQSRNMNNLLNSNFEFNWISKPDYIGEVISGKNSSTIMNILDKIEDINKLELPYRNLTNYISTKSLMNYFIRRNYKFKSSDRPAKIAWFKLYFECKRKKDKIPKGWFKIYLELLKSELEKNLKENKDSLIVIYRSFMKEDSVRKESREIEQHLIDYLLENFKNCDSILNEIRILKSNLKNKNNYFMPSYYYTKIENSLIKNKFNFGKIKIRNEEVKKFFKDKMILEKNNKTYVFNTENLLDYFCLLKEIFTNKNEEDILLLIKKYNRKDSIFSFNLIFKMFNENQVPALKDLSLDNKFNLIINSNYKELESFFEVYEKIDREIRKGYSRVEIKFNDDFSNIKQMTKYLLRLRDMNNIYYSIDSNKFYSLNEKEINDYTIEVFNGDFREFFNDNYLSFFDVEDLNIKILNNLLILKKNEKIKSLIFVNNYSKDMIVLGEEAGITYKDIERLYDC